jgi:hypothetical protein
MAATITTSMMVATMRRGQDNDKTAMKGEVTTSWEGREATAMRWR